MVGRHKTTEARFWAKVSPEPNSGCWLWAGAIGSGGYGHLGINRTIKLAHRISWEIHRGKIPRGLCALHKCDNRFCVNPDHIFLGTRGDNAKDMAAKGRAKAVRGSKNVRSKLTEQKVLDMRRIRRDHGTSYAEIARVFGVSPTLTYYVVSGRHWRHVRTDARGEEKPE